VPANTCPSLGFWRSWSLVVGSIVGSGVFLMPTVLAPYGGLGILSVAAAGIAGLCIAMTFSELSARVSGSGGPYAYARAGLGEFAGFLVAWVYWAALWAGGGAIATAIPGYLSALFPRLPMSPGLGLFISLLAIWSSVVINWLGIREAAIVGLITTLMKLVPLALVATIGICLIELRLLPAFNPSGLPPFTALATAFAIAFFSYVGIEAATVPAEDVLNASVTVPRATTLGTLTVMILYLLVIVAAMGTVPASQLEASTSPLAVIAGHIAGRWGVIGIALAALVSFYSALHYTVLLGAQIPMVVARDGLFPSRLRHLSARGTPDVALLITGILMSSLIVMNSSKELVRAYTFINLMATLATVVPYAFCAVAALLLPPPESKIARAGSKAIAVATFVVSFFITAGAGSEVVYWFTLLLLAGVPIYAWCKRPTADQRLSPQSD
jgi:basic amino acid/polyamine antiporter, APA family